MCINLCVSHPILTFVRNGVFTLKINHGQNAIKSSSLLAKMSSRAKTCVGHQFKLPEFLFFSAMIFTESVPF